ncbi:MAG TPA: iron-containing alcohol dehydrogenase [Pirellulales bacterium]|nr:iron-containing alcohol dehydrogenase [Pirellulales bacterium]
MDADLNQLEPLRYDLISPQKIVFGWGRRREVGNLAAALGRRAFVVEGSGTLAANGTLAEIADLLATAGMEVVPLAAISREPVVDDVDAAVARLRDQRAGPGDVVVVVGGGSAIDLAKAAAALATNRDGDSVKDYLEGVGRGFTIVAAPLPLVALPTTGGTGTEATKNAVISSFEPPFKKSLRSELMVPRVVLVDPELSVSVPPATTAWTGMDAITQLIESSICRFARPIPQALAVDGLRRAVPAIVEAVRDGTSRPARECMAHAALLSGMALANSGLGLAHGVAAALGVHSRVAHGLACAVMLPVALRVNRHVRQRELAELARAVLGGNWASDALAAGAFIEKIEQLGDAVGVPRRLRELGVRREQISAIVVGSRGNSMNGNPRDVSDEELTRLLEEML